MDNIEKLESKDEELKKDLLVVYTETKNLFIESEELLPEMRFFAAPTLEHRDALEHIMRYMKMTSDRNNSDAIKQLESALGHEIRAYFDTADYVSISVRDEIRKCLKRISTRKIKKNWSDYADIKEKLVTISNEIADIRKQKSGDMESVERYKSVIQDILDIYKNFVTKVEPRLRK